MKDLTPPRDTLDPIELLAQGKVHAITGFSFSSYINLKSKGVAEDVQAFGAAGDADCAGATGAMLGAMVRR